MSATRITVSARVVAPIEHVWSAYTTPDDITQWNFASEDWCCPWATNDLAVGGTYVARMEAKDGSFGFDLALTYTALTPGESFTCVMEDGRVVTTTFQTDGAATVVTTVFDAETENPVDMQRDGWQAILNNFKSHAEAGQP